MPDKWAQHDVYARSIITLNIMNPVGASIIITGSATDAWSSFTAKHEVKTDLGLLHAEEELTTIKYTDSMSIETHFKAMCTV